MTAAGGRAARPLWRERNFGIFWAAQTLSAAGDSFAYIAVPLLVLRATGSVAQMGLLTGVAGAAAVCAGIGAGVLVDRVDPQYPGLAVGDGVELAHQPVAVKNRQRKITPSALRSGLVHLQLVVELKELDHALAVVYQPVEG